MTRHRLYKRLSAAVARFASAATDALLAMVFLALGGYALSYVLGLLAQLVEKLG